MADNRLWGDPATKQRQKENQNRWEAEGEKRPYGGGQEPILGKSPARGPQPVGQEEGDALSRKVLEKTGLPLDQFRQFMGTELGFPGAMGTMREVEAALDTFNASLRGQRGGQIMELLRKYTGGGRPDPGAGYQPSGYGR